MASFNYQSINYHKLYSITQWTVQPLLVAARMYLPLFLGAGVGMNASENDVADDDDVRDSPECFMRVWVARLKQKVFDKKECDTCST